MSKVYIDKNIDCTKNNCLVEKVTGFEHGVKVFRYSVFNDKEKVDLSECIQAAYFGTKQDGKIIGNECEIADDKILLPLSLQMTTASGRLKGSIALQFPTGKLKFFGIDFEVFPSPETAEIESTDEFTVLDKTLAQARELLAKAENGEFNGADGKDGQNGADGKNYEVEIVEITETTIELQPNKFYKFGEVTELNLTLAEITDNTQLSEFMFEFISGETATTLILPDTIKWIEAPEVVANKVYQCSIVNNVGLMVGVAYE